MYPIFYVFSIFKIIYINIAYISVGLSEDEFHNWKGNTWLRIGHYERAIKNYKKSLKEEEDSLVYAAMGWCYAALGMMDLALESYRNAHKRNKHQDIKMSLAFAECANGNFSKSQKIIENLHSNNHDTNEEIRAGIAEIKKAITEKRTEFNSQPYWP